MKAVKAVLTPILCILAFILLVSLGALIAVRPANLLNIAETVEVPELLSEDMISDGIIAAINDLQNQGINIDVELDKASLQRLLQRDSVTEEIDKVTQSYMTAIAQGDYYHYVTTSEIVYAFNAMLPDIRSELGYEMTIEDYEAFVDSINDTLNPEDYSVGRMMDVAGIDATYLWLLMSVFPMLIVASVCALVFFNIFLLHRKNIKAALLIIGIVLALAGLLFAGAGLLIGTSNFLLTLSGVDIPSADILIEEASSNLLMPGIVFLIAGCVSILASVLIGIFTKKDLQKDNATQKNPKIWLFIGIGGNAAALAACFILVFSCFSQMQNASAKWENVNENELFVISAVPEHMLPEFDPSETFDPIDFEPGIFLYEIYDPLDLTGFIVNVDNSQIGFYPDGVEGAVNPDFSTGHLLRATHLVLELSEAPSGALQLIWQGEADGWAEHIKEIPLKDLELMLDGNTLTIPLVYYLDNYHGFAASAIDPESGRYFDAEDVTSLAKMLVVYDNAPINELVLGAMLTYDPSGAPPNPEYILSLAGPSDVYTIYRDDGNQGGWSTQPFQGSENGIPMITLPWSVVASAKGITLELGSVPSDIKQLELMAYNDNFNRKKIFPWEDFFTPNADGSDGGYIDIEFYWFYYAFSYGGGSSAWQVFAAGAYGELYFGVFSGTLAGLDVIDAYLWWDDPVR